MSLFYTDVGVKARSNGGTNHNHHRVTKITDISRTRLSCSQCPLDKEPLQHPKIKPTGVEHPIVYILGEAPGRREDELGRQFVGDAGDFLRPYLPEGFDDIGRWNNVLRCRPPSNREPDSLEIECCRRLQIEDIEQSKPQVIIAFGRIPLQWMLGGDRQLHLWRGRRMPIQVGSHTAWLYIIEHPASLLRRQHDKKYGAAAVKAFERDVRRVFSDIENGLPQPYVEPRESFLKNISCLNQYGKEGLAAIEHTLNALSGLDHTVDIETNMLRPYNERAKILSIAVGTYNRTLAFPWRHPEAKWTTQEDATITEMVFSYLLGPGRKWAHGAKFEQEWFHHLYGPSILYKTQWGDTLAQAHVLDGRECKELDDLTQIHFGFRVKQQSSVDRKRLEFTPLNEVLPYNGMDTKYTDALRVVQTDLLAERGLAQVYDLLHSFTPSIVQMQAKGIVRNLPAIRALDKAMENEEKSLLEKILLHKDVSSYRASGAKFNPASNPNLVSFFRDFLRLPNPKYQGATYNADEQMLSLLDHPVARLVLEFRSTQKNHGYVTPLLPRGKYVADDELVHASYSQCVAISGRSACRDPNQQNYPRRKHKEVRRVVGCPTGHKFVAFDYKQLEWRVGAMLSGDENMTKEIWDGGDIHGEWTDNIGGKFVPKKLKQNRKEVRDSMKQYWTFGNLYGQSIESAATDLSREFGVQISVAALSPFWDRFWGKYPGLKGYQNMLMEVYWELGYVETGTGQRRYEPAARNEIINHPFQGTAGHIVLDAQRRLGATAYEQDCPSLCPILNIHDDLSFYFPVHSLEENIETVARLMCTGSFELTKSVPIAVEVSIGDNWCDKEEIASFSSQDFR